MTAPETSTTASKTPLTTGRCPDRTDLCAQASEIACSAPRLRSVELPPSDPRRKAGRGKRRGGLMTDLRNATAPAQARRFGKTRAARAASMLEDCTELIADLHAARGEARMTDIASHLGVAHPTASKAIARLKRQGLAVAEPYRGVFLTPAGQALADRSRQRHRLVVDLLARRRRPAGGRRGRRRGRRALCFGRDDAGFRGFSQEARLRRARLAGERLAGEGHGGKRRRTPRPAEILAVEGSGNPAPRGRRRAPRRTRPRKAILGSRSPCAPAASSSRRSSSASASAGRSTACSGPIRRS